MQRTLSSFKNHERFFKRWEYTVERGAAIFYITIIYSHSSALFITLQLLSHYIAQLRTDSKTMKRVRALFGSMLDIFRSPNKKKRTDDSHEPQRNHTTIIEKTDLHTARKQTTINDLPEEALEHIFSYVGKGLYSMIAPTSKRFHKKYRSKETYIKNVAESVPLAQMYIEEMMHDTKTIGEAYHKLIFYSAKFGNIPVFQWAIQNEAKYLHGRNLAIHKKLIRSNVYPDVAALAGNIDMLKFLKSVGCVFTAASTLTAICGGKLDCVKFLHENGIPLNKELCSIETGYRPNLEVVRYLYEKGYQFGSSFWESAAFEGNLDTLKFLLNTDLPFDEGETFASAAMCGQLCCIKYLHENGYSWDEKSTEGAISEGKVECLEYLCEHGCPFYENCYEAALENNQVECLEYLCENGNGAPLDTESCCEIAARCRSLDCLQYLHERGYPWDEQSCESAARSGSLHCLTYLHDNECPWSSECIVQAIKFNHVHILRYLHENGCPWGNNQMYCRIAIKRESFDCLKYLHVDVNSPLNNAEFCTVAARRGNVEILTYLRQNHCEWDESECCRVAIEECRFYCLKFLIENECFVKSEACFRMAVRMGSLECFKYLHEKGFSWNPSYCASASVLIWRDLDCLQYLLENGFDLGLDEAAYFDIFRRFLIKTQNETDDHLERYNFGHPYWRNKMSEAWRIFKNHDDNEVKVNTIRPLITNITK